LGVDDCEVAQFPKTLLLHVRLKKLAIELLRELVCVSGWAEAIALEVESKAAQVEIGC